MPAAATMPTARAVRLALDGSVPARYAALLAGDDHRPVALVGRWAGAAAIVAGEPVDEGTADDDAFALLDRQPVLEDVPEGFVGGGWFGALGYRLGAGLERLAPAPPALERLPAAMLAFYDHLLRLDAAGQWWFEALWSAARASELERRLAVLRARLATGVGAPQRVRTGPWRATPSPAGHARAVAACRERIAAGDLFQANLAMRLRASLTEGRPVDVFVAGVASLTPDRAAFVGLGDTALASLSPELFAARRGDEIRTAPIKGTRPRREDPVSDAAERAALATSEKDRAENVMIVDLMRNDLGRVCEPGSVRVEALAEVRPHAGVWHLVSEVAGRRRAGVEDGALVAALFPPGSVTGAPKLAAMDVISALESVEREAFCGAIGFVSPTAGLELSVAIRTFELRAGDLWLDVGGGVVADSDPDAEAAECLAKARPLLAAIGGRLDDGTDGDSPAPVAATGPVAAARGASTAETIVPGPPRLGARPVPRPDPARGIFETLLVRDGLAVAAERHLARLASSADELFGVGLPGALAGLVDHTATEQGGPCRLRVLLEADGAIALDVGPLPEAAGPLVLEPVCVPGGIGSHKWRDRRLLEALEALVAPLTPLLVDLDGQVLETARSCVFAVVAGELVTPPLDGRILPGVTRARVLEEAADLAIPAAQRLLTLHELHAADAAFAVNALRGAQPIAAIGSIAIGSADGRLRTLMARFPQLWE